MKNSIKALSMVALGALLIGNQAQGMDDLGTQLVDLANKDQINQILNVAKSAVAKIQLSDDIGVNAKKVADVLIAKLRALPNNFFGVDITGLTEGRINAQLAAHIKQGADELLKILNEHGVMYTIIDNIKVALDVLVGVVYPIAKKQLDAMPASQKALEGLRDFVAANKDKIVDFVNTNNIKQTLDKLRDGLMAIKNADLTDLSLANIANYIAPYKNQIVALKAALENLLTDHAAVVDEAIRKIKEYAEK